MSNALRFKNTNPAKQAGEKARLKVVTGPDKGAIFVVTGSPVGVGRGESCDVSLTDLKCSRLHAELNWTQGGWIVRDMGSSNGVRYNGQEVKQAVVSTGDTVAVGETILEFISIDAGTMVLTAPPKSLEAVQADQRAIYSQKDRIQAIASFGGVAKNAVAAPASPASPQQEKIKRLALVGIAGIVAVFFLFPDGKTKKSKPAEKKEASREPVARDLASYLPKGSTSEITRTVEMFYKTGFREFREGNYLRAKGQFETVLQIDPGHKLARLYLSNCEKSIEDEVKANLTQGRKSLMAGKLSQSKGHYEAVMRLLYKDQSSPSFIEAQEQLEKVVRTMKGEGSS